MMDSLFLTINEWMTSGSWIAALGCLLWGVVSVLFSPCHLASIPLIVAYVGGQDELVQGRQAVKFSVLFSVGLFISIAIVGITCSLLGRMLGDVGSYWTILIGVILLWVAVDMLGVAKCSMPGSMMTKLQVKGALGAFTLGVAYGVLSGSCTFGFIAPILAMITVQEKIATGILLIIFFGIGHCLPIAVAGSSTATVKKLLASSSFSQGIGWFRKGSGVVITGLGLYFIALPFV
ncbi:MAG: cytochrome C biosynthesis protein [Candidatus Electrothrix sp. AR4]|nr:cytochrome C biosynthesis protein [Candidatus Electrothrix sp. AR4]